MHETEEKIIRSALQYFAENDFQNASLNTIAKAIGITKGGIYHYFDSKEVLLKRCIIYFFDLMSEMLEEMIPGETDIGIDELVGSFFALDQMFELIAQRVGIDFLNDYSTYLYLLFTGFKKFPELKKRISEIYFGSKEGLTIQLEQYKAKGEIRADLNCEALAAQLLVMSEGFMLFSAVDADDSLKIRESGREIVENFIRSLK